MGGLYNHSAGRFPDLTRRLAIIRGGAGLPGQQMAFDGNGSIRVGAGLPDQQAVVAGSGSMLARQSRLANETRLYIILYG
jgi:hypothetical protein